MFNTINNRTSKTYVSLPDTINVYEHKAPTDDSIKLLNEMQEKAKQNIISSINICDNTLNGVAIAYENSNTTALTTIEIYIRFSINGTPYEIKRSINRFDIPSDLSIVNFLRDSFKAVVYQAMINHFKIKLAEQFLDKDFSYYEKRLGIKF